MLKRKHVCEPAAHSRQRRESRSRIPRASHNSFRRKHVCEPAAQSRQRQDRPPCIPHASHNSFRILPGPACQDFQEPPRAKLHPTAWACFVVDFASHGMKAISFCLRAKLQPALVARAAHFLAGCGTVAGCWQRLRKRRTSNGWLWDCCWMLAAP